MSEVVIAVILGIVQGLTEFLPVSSSGHIEIVKYLFGVELEADESLMMTVLLHFGTALSTIVVFWKDIIKILRGVFQFEWNESTKFTSGVIISMIPAVVAVLLLEDQIEQLFSGAILLVAAMLILTGLLLFIADRAKPTSTEVTTTNAFLVGLAQAVAIIPGISRSGATIATSVLLNVDREQAARFSFLMVVPLIFGKMAKDLLSGEFTEHSTDYLSLIVGFAVAFVTGLVACKLMIRLVKNAQLRYFSFYCFAIAGIIFFIELI